MIRGVETLLDVESEPATSIRWAQLLVRLDPLREDAHRRLIRVVRRLRLPRRCAAKYDVCVRHLRDDLGVEPLIETTLVAGGLPVVSPR